MSVPHRAQYLADGGGVGRVASDTTVTPAGPGPVGGSGNAGPATARGGVGGYGGGDPAGTGPPIGGTVPEDPGASCGSV